MQQLQLHLLSDEQIALNPVVQEQLVELMAKVMLAVIAREREDGDDRQSS